MKERYTAQAHIKNVYCDGEWCPDLDEYLECHAGTPEKVIKLAESKSSTGEAYRLVLEQYNPKLGEWCEIEYLNIDDY